MTFRVEGMIVSDMSGDVRQGVVWNDRCGMPAWWSNFLYVDWGIVGDCGTDETIWWL